MLLKNALFGNLFREKCDFCPFLGDFSHFAKSFRQGVGVENGKMGSEKLIFQFQLRLFHRDLPLFGELANCLDDGLLVAFDFGNKVLDGHRLGGEQI